MVIRSLLTIQGTLHSLDEIRLWIENRNLRKGTSFRRLKAELAAKGVQHAKHGSGE
jgi:SOS response regulatory protein OraA/RecX